MKIATWNVNSVKARLPNLLRWLEEEKPDIACLQELKCVDEAFPRAEIEALGYNIETHGQKTYNGVALLSRLPLEDVLRGLPDFDDEQARYIEAVVSTPNGKALRVASLYLPNGNPVEPVELVEDDAGAKGAKGGKYTYKLTWMAALKAHAKRLLSYEEAFVLAGDYNVIPTNADCYDPQAWEGDALFRPETHEAYYSLLNLGLTEALSTLQNTGDTTYTFWDYQAGARRKNNGVRIDHHLLSPLGADHLRSVHIDAHTRDWEKPSDHVPVVLELDI